MPRKPKLGAKGYCLHCGEPIKVITVKATPPREPLFVNEWAHVVGLGYRRHCADAPVAAPKPHRKAVS